MMITISSSVDNIVNNRQAPMGTVENDCALILHASNDGYLVTRHPIVAGKMLDGCLIDATEAIHVLSNKTNTDTTGLVDARILLNNDTHLMWHKKSCIRSMFFTGKQKARLLVNWPNLIFVANKKHRRLSIYATATQQRPTMETPIYIPPLQNISCAGGLCIGSAKYPSVICQSTMKDVESCLMDSNFTYLNSSARNIGKRFTHYHCDTQNYKYWVSKQHVRVYASEMVRFGTCQDVVNNLTGGFA